MKHKYIYCGTTAGTDQICNFRLIHKCTRRGGTSFIRVNIPDDLELNTFPGDGYSTTQDTRTLEEVGYDIYIIYENQYVKANELKPYPPHKWHKILREQYSMYGTMEGYSKNLQWYKQSVYKKILPENIIYPKFKESKIKFSSL